MKTLQQLLESLNFENNKEIKRHAKGLLLSLKKSSLSYILDTQIKEGTKIDGLNQAREKSH